MSPKFSYQYSLFSSIYHLYQLNIIGLLQKFSEGINHISSVSIVCELANNCVIK